ncbi:MAG: DUF1109 domain-containing protein [Parvularculaceae bacterium]|nr:DUF1109 domain-containing protein [Parvularculaceae bacterium]
MRDVQSTASLIDGLSSSLTPVRRRKPRREIQILLAILVLQLLGTLAIVGGTSADVFTANTFKITSKALMLGGLAVSFAALAFRSLEPTTPKQKNIALVVGGLLVGFGILTLDMTFGRTVTDTLMPRNGARCLTASISLALPMFIALTIFMRGAAPTKPMMTALFIGIASGSWGVFVYGLQCPFTSLPYLATWYGGSIAIITAAAALILPRITRW